MTLYTTIEPILDFLISIRKMENFLIFDIKIPKKWRLLKKFIKEEKFLDNGLIEDDYRSVSFVCEISENEIEETQKNIIGIINFNLELEEKESLLENKISELKNLFEKENLNNLKKLEFKIRAIKESKTTQANPIIIDGEP
jgi:hypothetical protein